MHDSLFDNDNIVTPAMAYKNKMVVKWKDINLYTIK